MFSKRAIVKAERIVFRAVTTQLHSQRGLKVAKKRRIEEREEEIEAKWQPILNGEEHLEER